MRKIIKKLLLALCCVLFLAGSAWAIRCIVVGGGGSVPLSIIQHAGGTSSNDDDDIEINLASTPTVGNLLIAFISWGYYTVTPPAGWSSDASNPLVQGDAKGYLFYRIVQSGDGQNYTFTVSNPAEYEVGVMFEVGGDINTGDPYDVVTDTIATLTIPWTPNGITPSYIGCQGIAVICTERGTPIPPVSIDEDWTVDESQNLAWHGGFGASLNDLTEDTVTEIDAEWSVNSEIGPGVSYIVMVNPG